MGSTFLAAAVTFGVLGQLPTAPVVLTFSGRVDGSETIDVTPTQAVWTTNYFGTPDAVEFDGLPWDPQTSSTLVAPGDPFLPADLSNYQVNVLSSAGRDQVAAEISGGHLQMHIDDTPNGDDQYSFQVVLTPAAPPPLGPQTLLHVQGTIDGSDRIVITNAGATLEHFFWGNPTNLVLNGVSWDPTTQPTLPNSGATQFLPNVADFSSATFTKNAGRDLASFAVFSDHVELVFADAPVGTDNYDVTLAFASVPEPASVLLAVLGFLSLGLVPRTFRHRRDGRGTEATRDHPLKPRLCQLCESSHRRVNERGIVCGGP